MPERSRQERFLPLLEEHKKILYKVASSYCRNDADRQDLIKEIAVQLWRSFDRYDEQSPLIQRLMRDLAGCNLNAATGFVSSLARFEEEKSPA